MPKQYSIAAAIGFIRGWLAATDVTTNSRMKPLTEAIEVVITAAEDQTTEKESEGVPLDTWVGDLLDREEQPPDTQLEKEPLSTEKRVLKAFKNKQTSPDLVPILHEKAPYCYRCWHLSLPLSDSLYRQCQHYGIGIRATQAKRVCKAFERQPLSSGVTPSFTCTSCSNLRDVNKCRILNIKINKLGENKYGMCPFWASRFQEPVKFPHSSKKRVEAIDNKIKT